MRLGFILSIAIVITPLCSFTVMKDWQNMGNLNIEVVGLKNTKGQLGILLFEQDEGFPSENEKALKQVMMPISQDRVTYTFEELPFGNYAVAVMHDENHNAKLDTNFLGVPKEGTGVSNNVVGKLSAPKFKDASFSFEDFELTTSIKINY